MDYNKEDCTRPSQAYDLILDCAAYRRPSDFKRALTNKGRYVLVGGNIGNLFKTICCGSCISCCSGKKIASVMQIPNAKDLEALRDMVTAGQVKPAITGQFSLGQAEEAIRWAGGHAQGKRVIAIKA